MLLSRSLIAMIIVLCSLRNGHEEKQSVCLTYNEKVDDICGSVAQI